MANTMIPTVHFNGTLKEELISLHLNAANAVRAAIRAVSQASPNGRDFYVQGDGALHKAEAENRGRLDQLHHVERELMEIAEAILAQGRPAPQAALPTGGLTISRDLLGALCEAAAHGAEDWQALADDTDASEDQVYRPAADKAWKAVEAGRKLAAGQ
jgi:hypothetical protein